MKLNGICVIESRIKKMSITVLQKVTHKRIQVELELSYKGIEFDYLIINLLC